MLGQQRSQLHRVDVIGMLKQKLHNVEVSPVVLDGGRDAETLHLAEIELALLAHEPAFQPLGLLRPPGGPDPRHAGHPQIYAHSIVPLHQELRFHLADQVQQARQQTAIPAHLFPWGKALVAEVPAWPFTFQGITSSGFVCMR